MPCRLGSVVASVASAHDEPGPDLPDGRGRGRRARRLRVPRHDGSGLAVAVGGPRPRFRGLLRHRGLALARHRPDRGPRAGRRELPQPRAPATRRSGVPELRPAVGVLRGEGRVGADPRQRRLAPGSVGSGARTRRGRAAAPDEGGRCRGHPLVAGPGARGRRHRGRRDRRASADSRRVRCRRRPGAAAHRRAGRNARRPLPTDPRPRSHPGHRRAGGDAHPGRPRDGLRSRRPDAVVATIQAWPATGRFAGRRGFDSIVQAACEIADLEAGTDGIPGAPSAQALDHSCGYLLAGAILHALACGRGARVTTSLTGAGLALLALGPTTSLAQAADDAVHLETVETPAGRLTRVRSMWEVDGVSSAVTACGSSAAVWADEG